MGQKRIELVTCKAKDLKHGFANPRKITRRKQEELKRSLEMSGDFGIFIIDEEFNVIGGNQRSKIIQATWPEMEVTCKMLIGYTEQEKKAVNIKDNAHSGEWDLEELAEWTSDLNMSFVLADENVSHSKRFDTYNDARLIQYHKCFFVIIATRNETDRDELRSLLGVVNKRTVIGDKNHKTIPCRTVWFDDVKDSLLSLGADSHGR